MSCIYVSTVNFVYLWFKVHFVTENLQCTLAWIYMSFYFVCSSLRTYTGCFNRAIKNLNKVDCLCGFGTMYMWQCNTFTGYFNIFKPICMYVYGSWFAQLIRIRSEWTWGKSIMHYIKMFVLLILWMWSFLGVLHEMWVIATSYILVTKHSGHKGEKVQYYQGGKDLIGLDVRKL